eukprot:623483_1
MHQVINVLPSIHYNMAPIAVEDADGDISEHGYTLNREMDGMLVKFLHIFAQIRDMQYASFLPEVIVKMVYRFVGCQTHNIWSESEETKHFMKQIWERDSGSYSNILKAYQSERLQDTVRDDLLKAYLSHSSANVSILFRTELIIHFPSMFESVPDLFGMDCQLFVTNTGLYLTSAENIDTSVNSHIWTSFRDNTMIEKEISDNAQIDETMAFKIARNLIYDDVIINTKVVP